MSAIRKPARSTADAERQLARFIDRFEPGQRLLIRRLRTALRKRLPAAYELIYDNYNFLVLGYSPTERPSDAILSIAAAANGVALHFLRGATLKDPQGSCSVRAARRDSCAWSRPPSWPGARSKH